MRAQFARRVDQLVRLVEKELEGVPDKKRSSATADTSASNKEQQQQQQQQQALGKAKSLKRAADETNGKSTGDMSTRSTSLKRTASLTALERIGAALNTSAAAATSPSTMTSGVKRSATDAADGSSERAKRAARR
jgi:hypothetical protein